ncbi:hypothetical protein [Sinomonas soli]
MKDTPASLPRHHRPSAPLDPWRGPPLLPRQAEPTDPNAHRRQEQRLDDLIRAGLSEEQALAQLARLEAGDLWSG